MSMISVGVARVKITCREARKLVKSCRKVFISLWCGERYVSLTVTKKQARAILSRLSEVECLDGINGIIQFNL